MGPCLCGDTACLSCGCAQGTLDAPACPVCGAEPPTYCAFCGMPCHEACDNTAPGHERYDVSDRALIKRLAETGETP
jgi:hypothetical protein